MRLRAIILVVSLAAIAAGSVFLSTDDVPLMRADASTSWKSFDAGVAIAQREKKKVIIDVYTDWCTWCKKMDADTYADGNVLRILDGSFVKIKLNAESDRLLIFRGTSMSEAQFAREAGVAGYPATLFLDENLKPITLVPGYIPADRFAPILRFIGENHYQTKTFDAFLSQQPG